MIAYTKDPDAIKDYGWDWSEFLGQDTITASTWSVDTGITVDDDDFDTTTATVWLSGGALDEIYLVTNEIVTAAGRTDDRSFYVRVRDE